MRSFLVLCVFLCACSNGQTALGPKKGAFKGKTIVFIGNSITEGKGTSDEVHRWTTLVSGILGASENNMGVSGQVLQNGVSCSLHPVFDQTTTPAYSASKGALVISLGVNDAGTNNGVLNAADFKDAYLSYIDYAVNVKKWPRSKIFLLTPHYITGYDAFLGACGVSAPGDEKRLKQYVAEVKNVAATKGVNVIDINDAMKNHSDPASLLGADKIHPNNAGHAFIADYITKQLTQSTELPNGSFSSGGAGGHAASILFAEDAEGASLFPTTRTTPLARTAYNRVHSHENAVDETGNATYSWTMQKSKEYVYEGSNSIKFELRQDQPMVGRSKLHRSEVVVIHKSHPQFSQEMWYSFAILFPSKGQEPDAVGEVLSQWFEDGSSELNLRTINNKCYVTVTPPAGGGTQQVLKLDMFGAGQYYGYTSHATAQMNPIVKDTWQHYVFYVKHSTGSDGVLKIWRNGTLIHTVTGRNSHGGYHKWKLGLYKSPMPSSAHYSRRIFFDRIRVAKASATLAALLPDKLANR
jgi:lysophospholipase L1-like esterase